MASPSVAEPFAGEIGERVLELVENIAERLERLELLLERYRPLLDVAEQRIAGGGRFGVKRGAARVTANQTSEGPNRRR